ncbi:hypothetical protein CDV31_008104 [Fusarium ambrosium]|uniref:Uncharacterized protein n=1 Tax=Fusarium ambrosium TaxID=131363 RepID=A0A428U2S2_9HYPO|nr:hypothetical protein CDV31_008104 [Fusarium ambrosium]
MRWSEPESEKQVVRRAGEAVQALEETRRATGADPKPERLGTRAKTGRWCETSFRRDNNGLELVPVTGNLANFNSVRECLGSFDSRLS